MRFLILCQRPQRRGAEMFAQDFRRAVERQGHAASILYLYPFDGEGRLPIREDDITLEGDDASRWETTLGIHPGLLGRLGDHVEVVQPDVVVANGGRALKYAGVLRRVRSGQWRCLYRAVGEPGAWLSSGRARAFYRMVVIPGVDGVVAVSSSVMAGLRDVYSLPQPFEIIPRGIDLERLTQGASNPGIRRQLGTPACAPVLICVGSLSHEKRLDRAVAVLDRVRGVNPAAELWLVGTGPGEAAVVDAARTRPDGAIRVVGAQENVGDWLRAADVFLLTSDTEGTPGVLLEAGACGLPAVATDVGGVAECVEPGVTAMLCAPDDAELGRAMLDLLEDPELRQRMGAAAAEFVRDRFAIDSVAEAWVGFAESVIGEPTSR